MTALLMQRVLLLVPAAQHRGLLAAMQNMQNLQQPPALQQAAAAAQVCAVRWQGMTKQTAQRELPWTSRPFIVKH
jgi:hypothetical protein